ncbi:MAG: DoxX family protein [Flavobacteriaceae bacterium]|nr:MAG: DoxX family protein [Flavobacteriaceae bacterium]
MEFLLATAPLLLVSLFLCITFVFSIGEKLLDWKGTVTFYTHHFKGTFIAKIIPISLIIVLLLEFLTVVLFFIGLYELFTLSHYTFLLLALTSCAITLLVLLIGQRFAKDYPGAMSLGVYFVITILGLIVIP